MIAIVDLGKCLFLPRVRSVMLDTGEEGSPLIIFFLTSNLF